MKTSKNLLATLDIGSHSNAIIQQAVLRFFVNKVSQAGTLSIAAVTGGPWDEHTLTWTVAPATDAVPVVTASIFATDEDSYVTVDITPAGAGVGKRHPGQPRPGHSWGKPYTQHRRG
jgi:hypothetical protein